MQQAKTSLQVLLLLFMVLLVWGFLLNAAGHLSDRDKATIGQRPPDAEEIGSTTGSMYPPF